MVKLIIEVVRHVVLEVCPQIEGMSHGVERVDSFFVQIPASLRSGLVMGDFSARPLLTVVIAHGRISTAPDRGFVVVTVVGSIEQHFSPERSCRYSLLVN